MVGLEARPFNGRLEHSLVVEGPRPWIDVTSREYGAVGDGVHDDTTAIQAALDVAAETLNGSSTRKGATVYLPGGTYKTTAKLRARAATTPFQRGISILGAGSYVTQIVSNVPGDYALSIEGVKYSRGGRFSLINATGSLGTTGGIEFTGYPSDPATGTVTNGNVWDQLFVDGYQTGVHLGSGNYETSEMTFNHLLVQNCGTGILGNGFNSLCFVFNMLLTARNAIGLDAGAASYFVINGGSSTHNAIDIKIYNGGSITCNEYRTEHNEDKFIYAPATTVGALNIILNGCRVVASEAADGAVMEVMRAANVEIIGGSYEGKIFVKGWPAMPSTSLQMFGVQVGDTVPFRPRAAGDLEGVNALVAGCKQWGAGFIVGSFDNFNVVYGAADAVLGGWRLKQTGEQGWNGATPIAKPTVTGSRLANAALASLLTALANLGLITDSTS